MRTHRPTPPRTLPAHPPRPCRGVYRRRSAYSRGTAHRLSAALQTVLSYVRRDSSGAALLPSRFLDDIPEKFKAMFVRAGAAAASSGGSTIALGGNTAASSGKAAASVRIKARPFVDHDSLPVAQPRGLSAACSSHAVRYILPHTSRSHAVRYILPHTSHAVCGWSLLHARDTRCILTVVPHRCYAGRRDTAAAHPSRRSMRHCSLACFRVLILGLGGGGGGQADGAACPRFVQVWDEAFAECLCCGAARPREHEHKRKRTSCRACAAGSEAWHRRCRELPGSWWRRR